MFIGDRNRHRAGIAVAALAIMAVMLIAAAKTAYAAAPNVKTVVKDDVLTVYYDDKDHSSEGTVTNYSINKIYLDQKSQEGISKIIIDPSVKNLELTGIWFGIVNCNNKLNT